MQAPLERHGKESSGGKCCHWCLSGRDPSPLLSPASSPPKPLGSEKGCHRVGKGGVATKGQRCLEACVGA